MAMEEVVLLVDEDDDDFLSQVASLESHALLHLSKRRKISSSPPPPSDEGVYTAALRGSRSSLFHQISSPHPTTTAPKPHLVVSGGGGGECFRCGKTGHWARDCDGGGGCDDVADKVCPCGAGVCVSLTANTERNRGRRFYKCPLRQENGGCGFFEWCDKNTETDPITVKNQSYAPDNSASDLSCPCGAGACLILTAKTGKNIGQQFYKCPAIQAKSCGFFKWCHEHKTSGDTLSFSANASTTYKTITTSQNNFLKENSSSCFKCGNDGQWARDCSFSATPSSAYTTGKPNQKNFATNSGSSCFKCGKDGHWAKDCSF